MSMFWCDRCLNLRDSDDGCEEWGPKLNLLICEKCAADVEEEREATETAADINLAEHERRNL